MWNAVKEGESKRGRDGERERWREGEIYTKGLETDHVGNTLLYRPIRGPSSLEWMTPLIR